MLEIHNSYLVLYVIGIIIMCVNLIRCICCKKGHLFNPAEMEEKRDEKTFLKIRGLYGISQSVMLVIYVICFFNFKNFAVALVGFLFGNLVPVAFVNLYDSYLHKREKQ